MWSGCLDLLRLVFIVEHEYCVGNERITVSWILGPPWNQGESFTENGATDRENNKTTQ